MLSPGHPILEGPFPLAIEFEDTPTPDNFRRFDPTVGDTVRTFPVFRSKFSEPGLVTGDHGFEDVPDAERILGGINMKGPGYAAVARHGSFVMWGFQGYADELTDVGRRLFLNVIDYAASRKGAAVETLREWTPRDALAEVLFVWRGFYEKPEEMRASLANLYVGESIPDEIVTDVDAASAWFEARRPYLRPADDREEGAARALTLDRELSALGIGNADPKLLSWLAARLGAESAVAGADPERERALLLLGRYVPEAIPDDFALWWAATSDRLYFTETGGYVWRSRGQPAGAAPLRVAGASQADPLVTTVRTSDDSLELRLEIAAPWRIYAPGDPEGRGLRLEVMDGSAFELGGELEIESADRELHGSVLVRAPLARIASGTRLEFELTYVACDPRVCRPPKTLRISR